MTQACDLSADARRTVLDARVRAVLAVHLHPRFGSRYWLRRQEALGWDVCDRIRSADDLWLLGPTPTADLRRFPLRDFVPAGLHGQLPHFVVGETAGTSGRPCLTAYRADEFRSAFVTPFIKAARAVGFPLGGPWLWIGPSGPHIIGKAVRELARRTGSPDPFSVDFDPRWAKRLPDGSLARTRYLEHVVNQALDVLAREEVSVLFTTPSTLAALARRMTDRQREAVRGVHYGGLSLSADELNGFRGVFPHAVHLSGYGNTLFGVLMEVADGPRRHLDYYPLGDRVLFHVTGGVEVDSDAPSEWPPPLLPRGATGRVLFHRLDFSCLLTGVVERDEAVRVAPSAEAADLGVAADGLRDPQPAAALGGVRLGLY
jgi:hypothetical protein